MGGGRGQAGVALLRCQGHSVPHTLSARPQDLLHPPRPLSPWLWACQLHCSPALGQASFSTLMLLLGPELSIPNL